MLARVESLAEVEDLSSVATDFKDHFTASYYNDDIIDEFPSSDIYANESLDEAVTSLRELQAIDKPSVCQRFVTFAGNRAVGLALIAKVEDRSIPIGVKPEAPTLSYFICNPYRQRGLGRLTLEHLLTVADEQFDNMAWAAIGRSNLISQRMVANAGLVTDGNIYDGWLLYLYGQAADTASR
jgi:hypothetical protein